MIAIILVSYRSDELTVGFVDRELSKVSAANKVVIVNNAGTPESDRFLAERLGGVVVEDLDAPCPDSRVYVLHSGTNLGFARGNNLGAEFSRRKFGPDLFLFTNNDIHIVDNDIVECLSDKLAEKEEIGMIGPRVTGLDGKAQSPESYLPFWTVYVRGPLFRRLYPAGKRERVFKTGCPGHAQEGFCDKVMGSFFMVRARDFYDCGMMDPRTFLYYEELILAARMEVLGKRPYYVPSVEVIHEHAVTVRKHFAPARMVKLNLESASVYYHFYRNVPLIEIFIGSLI